MNLESSQTQLEELKRQLGERDEEIARLKSIQPPVERRPLAVSGTDISLLAQGVSREVALPISQVLNELYRLGDYLARGQQMVTLLIGQGRQTPQVQEAMRRVDWAFVSGEGPQVVKRAVAGLQEVQASLQDLQLIARAEGQESNDVVFGIEADRVPSDLNDLVVRAIETVKARTSAGTSGGVQIDRHLLLDRPVRVNPLRFEQAVVNLLSNAVESLEGGGVVRVLTRPRGARAEIEITDTGCGMEDSVLARAIEPFFTTKPAPSTGLGLSLANSIVRLHDGGLSIASRPGSGSTVLIDLPLTN
jgi:signal transduction histidine kinase